MIDVSTVHRSYKYRFYPNAKQRKQLAIEFGCARWVYNTALEARRDAFRWYGINHNYIDLSKAINQLKKDPEYCWLKKSASQVLTQSLLDLESAFQSFFKHGHNYPKFKKKKSRQSCRYQLDQVADNFKAGTYLKAPKLGLLKIRWSRLPTGRPKLLTISQSSDMKYWCSFSCTEARAPLRPTGRHVGVDMGIKDVVATSDGYTSGAPRNTYKYARELKLAQRKLARKQKGSNRRKRQAVRVARIYAKITNSRHDFLHKLSHKLVKENDLICIEDLNVAGMVKNRKLSKAVLDVGMGELRRQIEYKSNWYGKHVSVIDRWFPSTKMCSGCGQIHDMPLSKRTMSCDCGTEIDRDHNAAINIMAEGFRSLNVELDTSHQSELAA